MILVTVGTQLPFDRLIAAVDDLAPSLDQPVLAQIGKSDYRPRNIKVERFIAADRFYRLVEEASLIISHAGIGTVLTAQRMGKPVILFPRLAANREHRNDHQLATVNALRGRPGIYVAVDVDELKSLARTALAPPTEIGARPSREALNVAIAAFIGTCVKGHSRPPSS